MIMYAFRVSAAVIPGTTKSMAGKVSLVYPVKALLKELPWGAEGHIFALNASDKIMKKRLRLSGVLIFLATCFVFVFPKLFLRPDTLNPLNDISEVFGFALVLFGSLLRISGRGYKAEHSQEGEALVKDGPYGLVRNPMYLGIAMIGLGVVLVLFRWWTSAIFILIFTLQYILLIFKEERRLTDKFGREYKNYINSTPLILPKIKTILTKDIKSILPLKLSWIKKEIGTVLSIVLGLLAIESWGDIRTEGLAVYKKELFVFSLLIALFFMLTAYLKQE